MHNGKIGATWIKVDILKAKQCVYNSFGKLEECVNSHAHS